jgi:hypothetical protein
MLVNGAAQIEQTAFPFPQFAVLHSVTCVEFRPTKILGNCSCVAVASFLGVPSPLDRVATVIGLLHVRLKKLHESQIHIKGHSTTIIFHQHIQNMTINKTGHSMNCMNPN